MRNSVRKRLESVLENATKIDRTRFKTSRAEI